MRSIPTPGHADRDEHLRAAKARVAALDLEVLRAEGLLPLATRTYLTGTYPPLKAMEPMGPAEALEGAADQVNLYVHIPFCRQRCTFCHFAKEIKPHGDRVTTYLDALEHEVRLTAGRLGARRTAVSAYFGGGTPSQLTPAQMDRVFSVLHDNFDIPASSEVTFELHPQVTQEGPSLRAKLAAMAAGGVNRIAFGAQSLDDAALRTLNRGHGRQEVLDLLDVLAEERWLDVSVDLIYGLPGETMDKWFDTLTELVEHGVTKLNVFPLFFKVTDPVSWLYARKPHLFPGTAQRATTHFLTEEYLFSNGFERGPVLYYSKAGRHSRQQESKFAAPEEVDLLGLGVSSFGYVGGSQYYNHCDLDTYLGLLSRDELPTWRGLTLSADERARRTMMFGLRSDGVSRHAFAARFGRFPEDCFPDMRHLESLGVLELANDVWQSTDVGAYCVDGIAGRFASTDVLSRVSLANAALGNPRTSLLERHDYSPLGRDGASVPQERSR